MVNQANYALCGGIFFTLLLHARKQRIGVREHYLGQSDGLSEPSVLLALAKIVAPNWKDPPSSAEKTISGNTSRYKSCKTGAGAYFPFEDISAITSFDERIKKNYIHSLSAMNSFVDSFLEIGTQTKKDEYLVKALVEVIAADKSISEQEFFYVNEDGKPLTKQEICAQKQFCFQSFLLGVWHFIITQRKDNTIGSKTFDIWCPPCNGSKRLYTAKIGEHSSRSVSLTYSKVQVDVEANKDNNEKVEVEIISPSEYETTSHNTQQITNNNPVFNTFNFNGPIGTFNNQVNHITNNYYEGKKNEQ